MCGINGFNFENKELIELMNNTLMHRGPDDIGYFSNKQLSLGHVRLSILDLSKAGHQPMTYKHMKIVYNGEIYNFEEIKKVLEKKGYKFKSNSDTEVILAAYNEWGENCVKKFNGMWAFCIYDSKKRTLFLSRDRFGKKPLYYYNKDDKFIFSSEIKSILKTGIEKEIDKESLNEFFTYRFTFGEKTIFENIWNFFPGHNMIYDLKKKKVISYNKYYDIKIDKNKLTFGQAKEKLKVLLDDSVKKRMRSDVPVATFLSGGIDSSIITYYAKKYNQNLNTFSIGFDTTNELSFAKKVSEALKTQHHEFIINKDNVLEYLEGMIYNMDEPIGADPGFLPIYVLSKEVKNFNKVVLSGDGADEIFTGYDRYKLFYYGKLLKKLPLPKVKNEILNRLKSMKGKNDFDSFIEITRVFEREELEKLGLEEKVEKQVWNNNSLTLAQIFDIKNLLPKDFFMKSDKMSSAFGLEQRTPFMDYRIVEFGLSLPIRFRLKGWNEKNILKSIAKDILPKEISKRRKHGFNVPIDYWFENTLSEKLKLLLEKNKHYLYNKEYVYELLENIKNAKGGFKARNIIAQKLWTILVFEMWYARYMEK